MATTQLANLIEPKVFDAYARQQTTLKSALISSNVVAHMGAMDQHAAEGGAVFEAPQFNPFTWVESDVASDDPNAIGTPSNIVAGSQIGRTEYRSKSWSVMALAGAVSGAPVLDYAASIVGTYWAQDYQQNVLAKLKGIELGNVANNNSDMIKNVAVDTATISSTNAAGYSNILDAIQTMGDSMDKLGVIVMHSQVYTNLQKAEQIAFVRPASVDGFTTYYNKRVVVDDTCPVVQGTNQKTYTTYLLGQGAFAYGEAAPANGTEVWRNPAAGNNFGEDRLYSRKQLILHPMGFSAAGVAVSANTRSPSLAQWSAATAFNRVFDRKNCAIAILKTNG